MPHENQSLTPTHQEIEKFVNREISYLASPLMQHFINNPEALDNSEYTYEKDILPLFEKPDVESIAENGENLPDDFEQLTSEQKLQWACDNNVEVESYEAYEHWIISEWLAARLEEKGEIIGRVFGLTIWGRGTTGQAICMDTVIKDIANEYGL